MSQSYFTWLERGLGHRLQAGASLGARVFCKVWKDPAALEVTCTRAASARLAKKQPRCPSVPPERPANHYVNGKQHDQVCSVISTELQLKFVLHSAFRMHQSTQDSQSVMHGCKHATKAMLIRFTRVRVCLHTGKREIPRSILTEVDR